MHFNDITFVFQGGVPSSLRASLAGAIAAVRTLAPGCKVIVSTSQGSDPHGLGADDAIIGKDVPVLPGNKRTGLPNNINRQIQSTFNGLERATTKYAVKIRTDCGLRHVDFLDHYERLLVPGSTPLLVCSLFTIDPNVFEQMPYHVSDWFQFGETQMLREYWSCPFMTMEDAQYYRHHPHAGHSNYLDRMFYARLAVEQHIAVHYARCKGYAVPQYHNDLSADVMEGFRRFMAEQVIVLDPQQIGLVFDKYQWALDSEFQNLNCISHVDWQSIRSQVEGAPLSPPARSRLRRKKLARRAWRMVSPGAPLLYNRFIRGAVNRVLRLLTN